MLAIAGVFLLAASVVLFVWRLRRGIYPRYPWDQFALVGGAAALTLVAFIESPAPVEGLLFLVELGALGALTWYMGIAARFPRGEVSVRAGDALPRIQLRDSEGNLFDSDDLIGESNALYLFYRGDW